MEGGVLDVCLFFKQKTAYEMRISDWSSDVCSSDLLSDQFVECVHPPSHLHPRGRRPGSAPRRRTYVLSGRRPEPDVGNLLTDRRMRLYRCRLDMRACHPAPENP